jgi:hypothetical protein
MCAPFPSADPDLFLAHIECAYVMDKTRAMQPSFAAATLGTLSAIVSEAGRFADALNDAMDAGG